MITQNEQESVDFLMSMMGDQISDPEIARRVLRKCNGDMQKAATAILEGDRGEQLQSMQTPPQRPATPVLNSSSMDLKDVNQLYATTAPRNSPAPVIDLTADNDDDELSQALKASLETSQSQPNSLIPSERAPDPNWAMVPSNVPAGAAPAISHDDQQMDRAIQESLQGTYRDFVDELFELPPLSETIRQDDKPVTLPPTHSTLTHVALLFHALFSVPQVKLALASFRPSPTTNNPADEMTWALTELFAAMEFGCIGQLSPDSALEVCGAQNEGWVVGEEPGVLTGVFYRKLVDFIESSLHDQFVLSGRPGHQPRLFKFIYGHSPNPSYPPHFDETPLVKVLPSEAGDLVSRLSAQLGFDNSNDSNRQTIFEPSDVVAFELGLGDKNGHRYKWGGAVEKRDASGLRYPLFLFLDQFLQVNTELASKKRGEQLRMKEEVEKLNAKKKSLTSFNDKDTLKDLRASVYYYENVADPKGDERRKEDIKRIGNQLKTVLMNIEKEIEDIDAMIAQLKKESESLLDIPELQKLRYDLRAVLIYTGIPGRKHLYSYVNEKGKWWKTVDNIIEEVSEDTVLTDQNGLHLSAGPYLLLYSRAIEPAQTEMYEHMPWPQNLVENVRLNTTALLAQKPEMAEQLERFIPTPELGTNHPSFESQSISISQSQLPMDLT